MKTLRSTCFAMLMWVGGSAHAVNASDLARVVAPASLMAAYTCATYAEAAFAAPLALRLQQQRSASPYTAVAMKDLLTRFDAIVAEFCDAVDAALITHESDVVERFARAYAVAPDPEVSQLPGDAKVVQWFGDNNRMLVAALPLTALHHLVVTLAPDLLGPALRVPNRLQFTRVDDPRLQSAIERITTGDTEFMERRLIQLLVADPAFAKIAPPRFRLKVLGQAEVETRARGTALLSSGRHQWASLQSFSTTIARTRSHFTGFDVARAYGLMPAYEKAVRQLNLLRR